MHLRVSLKFLPILLLYCLRCCRDKHENRRFSFQTFLLSSKIHHKSLIHSKFVNFFLAIDCSSLAHSINIGFIGRECPNFEGDV